MRDVRQHINELDGLRFVAFLLIFIHHSAVTNIVFLSVIKNIGWLGVEIFFCLSAFLLTRLLREEIYTSNRIDVSKYFVRRILRIWPLYFCYLILITCFCFVFRIESLQWDRVFGLVMFLDNIFAAFRGFNSIPFSGHLWTISYEEQFYLVLPFLIIWIHSMDTKKRTAIFIIAFVIGTICRLTAIEEGVSEPFIWVLPFTHFDSILAGIILAFYESRAVLLNRYALIATMVLVIFGIYWLPDTNFVSYHLLIVYPMAGIFSGALVSYSLHYNATIIKSILGARTVVYLGKISFGLYVFHIFFMQLIDHVLGIEFPLLNLSVSFVVIVLVSAASYILLEKKFLDLKHRFT